MTLSAFAFPLSTENPNWLDSAKILLLDVG
jgi:hypothetical protein